MAYANVAKYIPLSESDNKIQTMQGGQFKQVTWSCLCYQICLKAKQGYMLCKSWDWFAFPRAGVEAEGWSAGVVTKNYPGVRR